MRARRTTAKRHLAIDVLGLLLTVLVTAASVQDRDAAKPLLWNLRRAFPSIKLAWADGGYTGKLVTWAKTRLRLRLEIVKRPDELHAPCPGSPATAARSATTSAWPPTTKPTSTGHHSP
jgi:Transposase DDE domain